MIAYADAVERLYALGHELTHTRKFDLAHMRALLAPLGNPQQRFASGLIAGTNGKGSTAATLASILRAAGHRTGLYTSPHLVHINERIRVDGASVDDERLADLYDRVEAAAEQAMRAGELPWHPSFFEMLTAMAFMHFAEAKVEIAVLEVGMGGRLDATNVVEPRLSVITDIALDHQRFLGETLPEIAREKAGIVRAAKTVVLLPQHPEANQALGTAIEAAGARAVSATAYMPPVSPGAAELFGDGLQRQGAPRSQYSLAVLGREICVDSPLAGRHQYRNLALAIAAAVELNACGFTVSAEAIGRGIRETQWPGRFQWIAGEPAFLLDVAHNPAGAWALRSAISERLEGRRMTMIFGAMRDKPIAEMAQILFPLAGRVIATHAVTPRAATPEQIREAGAGTGTEIVIAPSVAAAIALVRREATPGEVVVVTGSIFVVGEALEALGIET